MANTKICIRCFEDKEIECYTKDKRTYDGRIACCKQCKNAQVKKNTIDKPKPKMRFKHNGKELIECPGCNNTMSEKDVYRHMK